MGSASVSRLGTCPFLGIASLVLQISFVAQILTNSQLPKSPGFVSRLSILAIFGNCQFWQSTTLFRPLRSVLRSSLLAVGNAGGVERAAHYVIADSGEVFHAASADQHDRVLLQVVSHGGNVRRYFNAVGKAHAGHFAQRRVRLLGRLRIHAGANSAPLR